MKITLDDIRSLVTKTIFDRGVRYYKSGRVTLKKIESDRFEAIVSGNWPYEVEVFQMGDSFGTTCNCPYWDTCKHIVAAMMEAKDFYGENRAAIIKKKLEPNWKKLLDQSLADDNEPIIKVHEKDRQVLFNLELEAKQWRIKPYKAYIKKDGEFGRLSPIRSSEERLIDAKFATNDLFVISFLDREGFLFESMSPYVDKKYYRYGGGNGTVIELLNESEFFVSHSADEMTRLHYSSDSAHIKFNVVADKKNFVLKPEITIGDRTKPFDEKYLVLTDSPIWLLQANNLIKIQNFNAGKFLSAFMNKNFVFKLPQKELSNFVNDYLVKLGGFDVFNFPENFQFSKTEEITGKRLNLVEGEKHLEAHLKILYNDFEIDAFDDVHNLYRVNENEIVQIHRDVENEQQIVKTLSESGLKLNKNNFFQVPDSKALNWIFNYIPSLVEQGFDIQGKENLQKYKYNTAKPNVHVEINSSIDWFDLQIKIDFDGIELSLKELKKALQKNDSMVQLSDGSIAELQDDWSISFDSLLNFGKLEDQKVSVSRHHLMLVDLFLEKVDFVQSDKIFQENLLKLKNFEGIQPVQLPENLQGHLRDYQRSGYDWLYFLKEFSFGGCLADDMGLGKTVQALTLLLNEKKYSDGKPSLIICPTSVVFNWEDEVKKFTPALRVLNYTGIDRNKDRDEFLNYDLVLTSYGIMVRDIALFAKTDFHYVILDESQKVKNPQTLTSKAVRTLKSNYRLALTGTPIENNTGELWSLFAFLNPGLLGSLNYFKKAYIQKIEKKKNENAANQLRRLIFPFILRRTKEKVATELPPKIEQTYFCPMNKEQEKLYNHWKNYYRALLLKQIDEEGINNSRMRILEGLTKLRQLACHPRLVEEAKEDSGKFEMLQDTLQEIISENHKVLVFSQFVKMLTLIRNYLDQESIEYEYLDGHTRDRKERVDHFQTDENVKIFLISLKAGGTGINLTAADYVIHYDPWWNPAVEMQATDRTHRIGQDKKVIVYKFITKDTVEEKILQLQERKQKLVSQLITTDSNLFKSITREDVEALFT